MAVMFKDVTSFSSNDPRGEVTPRDREVAATVVQWLGSPVGQSFVKDVLGIKR